MAFALAFGEAFGEAFGVDVQPGAYGWKAVMEAIPAAPSMGVPRLPYLAASKTATAKLAAEIKAWCAETPATVRPSYCSGM